MQNHRQMRSGNTTVTPIREMNSTGRKFPILGEDCTATSIPGFLQNQQLTFLDPLACPVGSSSTDFQCPQYVRFAPYSDQITEMAALRFRAIFGHRDRRYIRVQSAP